MSEFYKWLDANIWAWRERKCIRTIDAVPGLMQKFGIHQDLAQEIVQSWVWSKNWN